MELYPEDFEYDPRSVASRQWLLASNAGPWTTG